ncbi:MAG: hypothetical protein CL508_06260 [Actinobacteria bacterium]|nr:hypothetical protein [Actinomycetota bacterium]
MNNISKIGFIISIIFVSGIIIYSITTYERFGDSYINQLRIADADKTLNTFSDEIVIEIGKSVCNEANNWKDEETSLFSIQNILIQNGIEVKKENRIIPIIRFHSIYELCPENINVLEELFGKNE